MSAPKEKEKEKDPLEQALMTRYLFEESPTIQISNPKVLLSAPLWLLLIAKDKVTPEDLITSRGLEGAYLYALRAAYIEHFPKIFYNNKNKDLLDEIVGYFKIMAQQYIFAAHVEATKAEERKKAKKEGTPEEMLSAAQALVEACHFVHLKIEKLTLRIETDLVQAARGAKAAETFRSNVLDLDPTKFSMRSENFISKLQKSNTGVGLGTDADDADDGKDRKRKVKKRKCMRCGKGPFTHAEFQTHNKECK